MTAPEEKDADDVFLEQELTTGVAESLILAGKSFFEEARKKRTGARHLRKNLPSEGELQMFVERTQAVARAAEYPSPETVIALKALVEETFKAYDVQVTQSGYREHIAALEKEGSAALEAALKKENLKRFYEIDFDKKCVPDAWLHDALIKFNKALAASLQMYGKNGLLAEGAIADWLTHFSYGVDEMHVVEKEDGSKEKVSAVLPHSVDAVLKNVRRGGIFLLESLVDQLINAPQALPVYKQESALIKRDGWLDHVPVLKPVWSETNERPAIEIDFDKYSQDRHEVALLLEKTAGVLHKLHDVTTAGLLTGIAQAMIEYNKSPDLPDENVRHRLLASLWESISVVKELPFDKMRAYSLADVSGEKMEVVLRAAELYHERLRELVATDHLIVGQSYFLEITRDHRTLLAGGVKETVHETLSKELVGSWIERCLSDEQFVLSLYHADHPFAYISKSLECFGVQEHHAREFENIVYGAFFRQKNARDESARSPEERAPQSLSHELFNDEENRFVLGVYNGLFENKDGDEFARKLRLVMEFLSGKKLPPFYATRFVKNKSGEGKDVRRHRQYSNGIWQEIMVSGTDTAGNLVEVDCVNFHKGDMPLLKRFEAAYPEHDLYVGGNKGVAWVFDIDMGWPKNPAVSKIELLDDDNSGNSLDNLVDYLQLAFHETRHIGQIGSRLMWRYVGVAVAEFFAKYALQKYAAGVLDKEAYFTDFNVFEGSDTQTTDVLGSRLSHPRTLRDHVLKWFSIFAAQALGVGKRAELLREYGPFKGTLWFDDDGKNADPRRFAISIGDSRNEKAILESAVYEVTDALSWEVSRTAKLVGTVLNAIEELSTDPTITPVRPNERSKREELEDLLYECRRARTEFSTIIETDAEVSGLYCTREVVRQRFSTGHAAYQKKFNGLVAGGALGEKVSKIVTNALAVNERDAALKAVGVQWVRVYDGEFALKTLPDNLKKLGFESADDAYKDMSVLEERRQLYNKEHADAQLNEKDVLTPMNIKRVDIQRRYRGNIADFMAVVETQGYARAVQIIENAESVQEVLKAK